MDVLIICAVLKLLLGSWYKTIRYVYLSFTCSIK